jgi:hypothetical protein
MAGQIDFIPTGAWELVRQPQFVEELTYGVMELEDNVWQNIGVVTEIGMEVTVEEDVVRILGNRDIYNQLKLGIEYAFAVRYKAQGTKFMRYGSELPARTPVPDNTMVAPNGTNFASISILLSSYIDNTQKWRIYKGAKTSDIAIGISRDNGIEIEQNFMAKDITTWDVEPTWVNNQYAGSISGNPWTGISMGADPLQVASTTVQCPEINFNIDQGLGQLKPTGIESVYYVGATNREITFDFTTWVKDNTRLSQLKNHTALVVNYLMNAGANIQTTGSKFNSYTSGIVTGSSDFLMEEIAGSSKTITIPLV